MGLAACPLVAARTEGEAVTCSTVECETCELLKGYLERKRGVVTTCPGCLSPGDIVLGFHLSGVCSRCCQSRMVLLPCQMR